MVQIGEKTLTYWYSWVVKATIHPLAIILTTGHNTPLGHYTDHGPMGLGQYNSHVEYCDPQTASSIFLILSIVAVSITKHYWVFG